MLKSHRFFDGIAVNLDFIPFTEFFHPFIFEDFLIFADNGAFGVCGVLGRSYHPSVHSTVGLPVALLRSRSVETQLIHYFVVSPAGYNHVDFDILPELFPDIG